MDFEYKNIIGMDISSHQIKIVKMDKELKVKEWSIASIANNSLEGGLDPPPREDLLASRIKESIGKAKPWGRSCALCLPAQNIISRVVMLPRMEMGALKENMLYDMESYLPLDLENYIIDFAVIGESMSRGVEYFHVLVTAILREVALFYSEALRRAGLKAIYFDTPSNCLHKLLMGPLSSEKRLAPYHKNLCLIDIGSHCINIIIFNKGCYFVDKTIPLEAKGFAPKTQDKNGMQVYMIQVVMEIRKVIKYFENHTPGEDVIDGIVMMGEGAMIPGILDYIKREIGMNVNLLSRWRGDKFQELSEEEFLITAKAIGSTIRRNPQ